MIWVPTWDAVKGEWTYTRKPAAAAASPPASRRDLGPFEMPARRNKPLPADHTGVMAAGEAVRRMR